MEEEMIRDESVFVIGEEVARYNGAYKASCRSRPLFRRAGRLADSRFRRSPRDCWTSLGRTELST